ncbi:myb-like DNA-binding domain-containing protein [Sarocladium implicatum]|nr:myb-like DNA-binding domain-containing protein [Sarocladium implicatum]
MAADGSRRGPWSQAEDRRLLSCISQDGPHNWVQIALDVGQRSAKQCRERYHQNLKPGLNHSPISQSEARYILDQVARRGPRWAEISRELGNNRSDNSVKNWWNGYMNRHRRQQARQAAAEAAGRPQSRSSAARSHSHDLPIAFGASGPAPLPSPTEIGFSPRLKEPSLSWSRDPLPPSPSSIASDHSLATAFSSVRRDSSSREATFGPDLSPRYHHMRRPITLPPIRAQLSERQEGRSHLGYASHEPRIMPGEAPNSPRDSLAAAYEASHYERQQPPERQYYHSHQLPPQVSQTALALRPARDVVTDGQSDSQRTQAFQPTRPKDDRMSLSNLVG